MSHYHNAAKGGTAEQYDGFNRGASGPPVTAILKQHNRISIGIPSLQHHTILAIVVLLQLMPRTIIHSSPLYPLLKHLIHEYATSAGSQDVLASRIVSDATTIDELHDFVLNETTKMIMMVGVKAKTSSSSTAAAAKTDLSERMVD